MAFCANCGSEVNGSFCGKCGMAVGATVPPPNAGFAGSNTSPSAAGLTDNVAAALSYVLGIVSAILFLAIAPYNQNPLVRFHAWQSLLLSAGSIAVFMAFGFFGVLLPFVGFLLLLLEIPLAFGLFGLWLFLIWKTFSNERIVLPFIGPLAEQQAGMR